MEKILCILTLLHSYYAYEHKYNEFAIRIAEGGVVPRRSRAKPDPTAKNATKASKKKAKAAAAKAQAEANMVQSIADTVEDNLEVEENEDEVTAKVEVWMIDYLKDESWLRIQPITDDLQVDEIAAALAEAEEIEKQDEALDESLQENQFSRKSQLDEPSRWLMESFVVGDPFIAQKVIHFSYLVYIWTDHILQNCAGSITKRVLNEFITQCRETLRMIDSGASLQDIISHRPPIQASTNGKGKGKNKGKEKEGKKPQTKAPKSAQRNGSKQQPGPITASQVSRTHAPSASTSSQVNPAYTVMTSEHHSPTKQRVNTDTPAEGSSISRNEEAPRVEQPKALHNVVAQVSN
jgi:hypothetical protein